MISLRGQFMYWFIKNVLSKNLRARSIEEEREYLNRLGRSMKVAPGISVDKVNADGVTAESLNGPKAANARVILYLHGGSYCLGSCDSHRAMVSWIAKETRQRVILLDYRLAPQWPFPAALDDTITAYHWLLKTGIDPRGVTLMGDSAGGGLAVAAATVLRDHNQPLPGAIVCWSPSTDLSLSGASIKTKASVDPLLSEAMQRIYLSHYVGSNDPRLPLMSPVYADLHGLPPLLIQVGEREILLDDALRLAQRARQQNVAVTLEVWKGMWHVWPYFSHYIPEGRKAIQGATRFLDANFA